MPISLPFMLHFLYRPAYRIGRFDLITDGSDWRDNLYFDAITGETKAVVTLERVPATDDVGDPNKNYGQIVVTNIEFL